MTHTAEARLWSRIVSCFFVTMLFAVVETRADSTFTDAIVFRVTGEFGAFNPLYSNLPEATYPFPNLINGGTFDGTFAYSCCSKRIIYGTERFPYSNVFITIKDKFGNPIHTIDSGPDGIFVEDGTIHFALGQSFGPESIGVPEDLRLSFAGAFLSSDPRLPRAQQFAELSFLPATSFIEVDGSRSFTYWDVSVASATLSIESVETVACPEPAALFLIAPAVFAGLICFRKRKHSRPDSIFD